MSSTTTTHKTLRGPRGGMILTNDEEIAKKVNSAIFPGIQGGPLMHVIAAKAVAFGEALRPEFKTYQTQVIRNAQALADELMKGGLDIVTGGTDCHLMLVDLRPKGVKGNATEKALGRANITCNKNGIPFDTEKPTITSGVRLGTPAGTTRGFAEAEFRQVGRWIVRGRRRPCRERRGRERRGRGEGEGRGRGPLREVPDLSGVRLATQVYGEAGDRPPLLIAHGLFGSARNWGVIAKRLAETRPVVAVDMRNHGDSPWDEVHDYPAMAGDLAEVIDGRWDVLGHSMGGKAAMVLALTHPEKVNRLVVADIAPVAYGHTQAHLRGGDGAARSVGDRDAGRRGPGAGGGCGGCGRQGLPAPVARRAGEAVAAEP